MRLSVLRGMAMPGLFGIAAEEVWTARWPDLLHDPALPLHETRDHPHGRLEKAH
ncbi:hypothetical protein [Streptomyces spinoverrucosus]|uniref:hypothetical protein n=1 Tax=Streptomyces spinoverrucosus TaxID=284043 RepID=UPI00142EDA31|nr:hypothetical protein [Streptomyces spinoverrucosus]